MRIVSQTDLLIMVVILPPSDPLDVHIRSCFNMANLILPVNFPLPHAESTPSTVGFQR